MEIDLLLTENERLPSRSERDSLHPEDAFVERTSRVDVPNGEDEVIESVDVHIKAPVYCTDARRAKWLRKSVRMESV